jgi:hypothetical protein
MKTEYFSRFLYSIYLFFLHHLLLSSRHPLFWWKKRDLVSLSETGRFRHDWLCLCFFLLIVEHKDHSRESFFSSRTNRGLHVVSIDEDFVFFEQGRQRLSSLFCLRYGCQSLIQRFCETSFELVVSHDHWRYRFTRSKRIPSVMNTLLPFIWIEGKKKPHNKSRGKRWWSLLNMRVNLVMTQSIHLLPMRTTSVLNKTLPSSQWSQKWNEAVHEWRGLVVETVVSRSSWGKTWQINRIRYFNLMNDQTLRSKSNFLSSRCERYFGLITRRSRSHKSSWHHSLWFLSGGNLLESSKSLYRLNLFTVHWFFQKISISIVLELGQNKLRWDSSGSDENKSGKREIEKQWKTTKLESK